MTSTASGLANAATRSAIKGTSFGDNLIAALPDVIGQAVGEFLGDRLDRASLRAPVAKGGATLGPAGGTQSNDAPAGRSIGAGAAPANGTNDIPIDGPDIVVTAKRRDFDFLLAQYRPNPRAGTGGNGGPTLYDPLTLQQVFPGLGSSPAGSILAPIDSFLGITGPADELLRQLTRDTTRELIAQIRHIDPNYRFESLGEPTSFEGQTNQLRELRLDRAEAFYRVKGEVRPLQVEAFRFLQGATDVAYSRGVRLYGAGKLPQRLSRNEAIGNYVDGQVRDGLKEFYRNNGINIERGEPVQVNRRAYNKSEGSYTVPDSRVGTVAFDVSLTVKTLSTAQIRGFFRSDFAPTSVIIVRPSQLGPNSSYIITRPPGR